MATEAQVRAILEDPFAGGRQWSLQGLGMLRTHLDSDEVERLHLWDPRAAFNDVSTIHDHPWDFVSVIISGGVRNQRYYLADEAGPRAAIFQSAQIRCGEGGGILSQHDEVPIGIKSTEDYDQGSSYYQEAPEIHESYPDPGAVTVIQRKFRANRDIANVYWQAGEWVSAEPRPATVEEVLHFISLAHDSWTGSIPFLLPHA